MDSGGLRLEHCTLFREVETSCLLRPPSSSAEGPHWSFLVKQRGRGGLCLSGDFALSSTLYSEIVTDLQEVAQILHRVLCTLHPAPRSCAHSGDSWVTVVPHQSREIH